MKKVGMILLVATLLLTLVIAEEIDPSKLKDTELESYQYGKDILKLVEEESPSKQRTYVNDYSEAFTAGVKESLKDPEIQKKLAEAWTKKTGEGENQKPALSDEVKNKIWESLTPPQRNSQLKEIIAKALEKDIGIDSEEIKKRLKSVKLTGNERWEGNKIGIPGKSKLKAWIDTENTHYSITNIEFTENNLQLKYDTGIGLKKAIIKQGSVNKYGEIMSPDGKIVGDPLLSGVEYVRVNGEKNTIDIGIEGKEKPLSVTQDKLNKILERTLGKEKANKIIDNLNDPAHQEILKKINFDTSLSTNRNNKLNILLGGDYKNEGVVEIDFDEIGRLNSKVSNGGNIASTDASGSPRQLYKQFYSKNGISDSNFNSGTSDESAEFKFDFNGDIRAAKNGLIDIANVGKIQTSRLDFVGTDIIKKNALHGAITRDGLGGLLPAIGSLEEFKRIQGKIEDGTASTLDLEIADIINKRLEGTGVETSLNKELNDALGKLTKSIENSKNNLIDDIYSPDPFDPLYERNQIAERVKTVLSSQTKNLISDLAADSQGYVDALASGDDNAIKKLLTENLASRLNDPELKKYVDSIAGFAGKDTLALTPKQIDTFVEGLLTKSDQSFEEKVRAKLPTVFKNDKIVESIAEIYGAAEIRLNEEAESIKSTLHENYPNQIIVDTEASTVKVTGNKYISFDSRTPLSGFIAESTRTDTDHSGSLITLKTNGNLVAQFDGEKSNYYRIIPNTNYQPIDLIVNAQAGLGTQNNVGNLATSNSQYGTKWAITYPNVVTTRQNGNVVIVGVPSLGTYHAMDMELIRVGKDSKIIVTNEAAKGYGDRNLGPAQVLGAQGGLDVLDGKTGGLHRIIDWFGVIDNYAANQGIGVATQQFLAKQDPGKIARGFGQGIIDGRTEMLNPIYDNWDRQENSFNPSVGKANYENYVKTTLTSSYGSLLPQSSRNLLAASLDENLHVYQSVSTFMSNNPTLNWEISPSGITASNGNTFNIQNIQVPQSSLNGRTQAQALNDAFATYQEMYKGIENNVKPTKKRYTP